MKPFAERMREDERLAILLLLLGVGSYTSNSTVIGARLADAGHNLSGDVLRSHLHWLAEQGLVSIDDPTGNGRLLIVKLIERGADVAEGRTIVPGVARPRP